MGLPSPFPIAAAAAVTDIFYAMPPIQLFGVSTYIIPIPDNCDGYQIDLIGAGGTGGAARGAGAKATGGGGAPWARILRKKTKAATSITAILGAAGVGVARATDGATAGNAGASSTVSDGTITLTVPGGTAGQAAQNATTAAGCAATSNPTVSDGGDIDYSLGGTSGSSIGAAATGGGASGGAGCGGPLGTGGSSGQVGSTVADVNLSRSSGGASMYANSGIWGAFDNGGTGGGGRFAGGVALATNTGTGGGGVAGAAPGGQGGGAGSSVNNQTLVGLFDLTDLIYTDGDFGGGSGVFVGGSGGSGAVGPGAGSGGTGQGSTTGATTLKGGSGGIGSTNISNSTGAGGVFGASGGACTSTGAYTANSGNAGNGCGSGGAAVNGAATATSGTGGVPFCRIQFFIRKS